MSSAQKMGYECKKTWTSLTLKWICGVRADPRQLKTSVAPKRLVAQPIERYFTC